LRVDWKAGGRQRWLIRAERKITEKATCVVASSPPITEHLRRSYGRTVDGLVENGVDFERFAGIGRPAPAGAPQLVYAGSLNAKLDWALLERLGSALPHAEIVLAGAIRRDSERSVSNLIRRPNIRHIGALAPEQVPELVAGAKVGLIPYSDTQYGRAGSPLKLFEYLAAGVPVVASGIAMGKRYHSPGIYFHAQDHDDFVGECSRLLARSDTPEDEAARRAVAADHDWALTLGHIADLALGDRPRNDVRPVSPRRSARRQWPLRSKVGPGA
jgi:teichuronic acid biosynthesis glycosyltransferase TuaH